MTTSRGWRRWSTSMRWPQTSIRNAPAVIAEDILSLARAQRLDADVNVTRDTPTNDALRALDAHLCDLKEMQIRDGLHVFGRVPADGQRNDLLVSIARLPRFGLEAAGCVAALRAGARSGPWRVRPADP